MRFEKSSTKFVISLVCLIFIGCTANTKKDTSSTIVLNKQNNNMQDEPNITKAEVAILQNEIKELETEIPVDVNYAIIDSFHNQNCNGSA